jgi:hypothetical protein
MDADAAYGSGKRVARVPAKVIFCGGGRVLIFKAANGSDNPFIVFDIFAAMPEMDLVLIDGMLTPLNIFMEEEVRGGRTVVFGEDAAVVAGRAGAAIVVVMTAALVKVGGSTVVVVVVGGDTIVLVVVGGGTVVLVVVGVDTVVLVVVGGDGVVLVEDGGDPVVLVLVVVGVDTVVLVVVGGDGVVLVDDGGDPVVVLEVVLDVDGGGAVVVVGGGTIGATIIVGSSIMTAHNISNVESWLGKIRGERNWNILLFVLLFLEARVRTRKSPLLNVWHCLGHSN